LLAFSCWIDYDRNIWSRSLAFAVIWRRRGKAESLKGTSSRSGLLIEIAKDSGERMAERWMRWNEALDLDLAALA
jgi:hypothetical protein